MKVTAISIVVGDYPNKIIIENGQNTAKSPGDLERFTDTHTQVEDQLTQVWKTLNGVKYYYYY